MFIAQQSSSVQLQDINLLAHKAHTVQTQQL